MLIGLTLHNLLGQRLRDVTVECLGNHRQLTELCHRLDAWHDRYRDAHLAGFLHKVEVFLVVEEQLGDGVLCTQVLLLFQILHIALQVGCLLVLLRIAGHTEVELRTRVFDRGAVGKVALVEACYLTNQVSGMGMTARRWCELAVFLGLVATQQHQVADT